MQIKTISFISIISLLLSACTLRTYKVVRERVDQEITGNRGYIQGKPKESKVIRKPTRTIQEVQIELHSPIKFERILPPNQKSLKKEDKELWGNLGYIEKKSLPQKSKKEDSALLIDKYTVQENDTLQKISQKFYGTTRFWYRIYELNKDIIKEPNKIYPGQIISIPIESKTKEESKFIDLK
ncbi:MAG: LysM peptidoglycan-binding domain-containing protein [Candidatus Omnitrophica bacterium]|nr:LysM peptidoglycan-binding domain-containing protein [Candidatus Omnitrophota bacterium]